MFKVGIVALPVSTQAFRTMQEEGGISVRGAFIIYLCRNITS